VFSAEACIPAGPVAYIDLDSVITGDWTRLLSLPLQGACRAREEGRVSLVAAGDLIKSEGD
jgi:hypothetical protein